MPEFGTTMSETYLTFFNALQAVGIIAAFLFAHWLTKDNERLHQKNQENKQVKS